MYRWKCCDPSTTLSADQESKILSDEAIGKVVESSNHKIANLSDQQTTWAICILNQVCAGVAITLYQVHHLQLNPTFEKYVTQDSKGGFFHWNPWIPSYNKTTSTRITNQFPYCINNMLNCNRLWECWGACQGAWRSITTMSIDEGTQSIMIIY
jgi:hypothetical protein